MKRVGSKLLGIVVVVTQVFIAGCAKEAPSSGSSYYTNGQPNFLDADSEAQAKTMAMNATVTCEKPNSLEECSPSVAMLALTTSQLQVGQCTAFLVSPDLAITNSHCIPQEIRKAGASCADQIWLHFPEAGGYRKIRAGCSRILDSSAISPMPSAEPDFAVIRLDQQVDRPPLSINREGFKNNSPYFITKVDPTSTTAITGLMRRVSCKAIHESVLAPGSNHDRSANMAFADCDIVKGNSGAPILDASLQVRGVIQLVASQDALTNELRKLQLPLLEGHLAELSIGTGFACLKLPSDLTTPAPAPECEGLLRPSRSSNESSAASSAIDEIIGQKLEKISKQLDPAFEWGFFSSDALTFSPPSGSPYHKAMVPFPMCIKDSNALIRKHHRFLGGYASYAEIEMTLPKLSLQFGLNRYTVPIAQMTETTEQLSTVLAYNPSDLAQKGASSFRLIKKGDQGRERILIERLTGGCPLQHP